MNVRQAAFAAGLLDPNLPAPEGLQNPGGDPASKRFDVYRNNVAVSLTDALETAFPIIHKLVGDEFFRAMAGVYLRKHQPSSPLMMFYGEHMPQFLRRFEPAKSLPYLPDIARLELALRNAYHAADAAPIEAQMLAELTPDALMATRFAFAPATQVISSEYPIHAIYRANTDPDAPKPLMAAENVLITRPQLDPQLHSIDDAAAACLTALMARQPLGLAMTQAGDDLDLGALLGLLLGQGAITTLT